LLLALVAAGCATRPTSTLDAFAQRSASNSFEMLDRSVDPPATLMLQVEHDVQTEGPSCGAHVLASVVNYWRGAGTVSGAGIYRSTPPTRPDGYTMAELLDLARANGLAASAVRIGNEDLVRELESGRPVLAPVRIPAIYLQAWTLPGANTPVIGLPAQVVTSRVGRLSEWTGLSMINHYVLISGYEDETFVALEPVLGFRTISFDRLKRYRRPFGDAAIVFSAPTGRSAGDAARRTGPSPSGG
jgi:hypothetical protein